MMDEALLSRLRELDTPTVCNAIEVAEGRRGFAAFTRGTMHSSAPKAPPIVGYAVTARIAAREPSGEAPEVVRERRMAYYRAMAEAPRPAVAVLADVDWPDCVGAFWGEINTTVHKALGVAGALTNGVMRDLGELPEEFPVVAGSIGPSHAHVHVREIGTPVTVFGLDVAPGDLVHADRHGAIVIPPVVVPHLSTAIDKLLSSERIVLDGARAGPLDFEAFQKVWSAFENART
jgi:regulator of RNase E activity RraA